VASGQFFCRLQIAVPDEADKRDDVGNHLEAAPEVRNNLAQRFSAGTFGDILMTLLETRITGIK
jgi:hypothetical protein